VTVGVTVVLVEPEALIPVVQVVQAAILEQAAPEQMDTILMRQAVPVVAVPVVGEQQGNLAAEAAELASMDKELAVALDLHNKAEALEVPVVIMDSLRVVVVVVVVMVVVMVEVAVEPQTALE
jgi:hypothetical protein